MKLLKYNVGDNLFILLENKNILIKKKNNIYNVFTLIDPLVLTFSKLKKIMSQLPQKHNI